MKSEQAVRKSDAGLLTTLIEINHEITSILDLDQLLNKIAELTQRIVPYQIFAIFLHDEEQQELFFRFAVGHSADVVQNLRIPLGDGLVSLLASQIAIAIENAKLYDSERRNRETLALLYAISQEMGSTLEVDELVHKIAAAVKSTINYQIFSIFLLDEKQQVLRPRIVIRYNTLEYQKLAIPFGTGLVGTAALLNVPLRVADVTKDPRYLAVHPETRSEMVVPLMHKSTVIGIIDLESTQLNYFTEDHE